MGVVGREMILAPPRGRSGSLGASGAGEEIAVPAVTVDGKPPASPSGAAAPNEPAASGAGDSSISDGGAWNDSTVSDSVSMPEALRSVAGSVRIGASIFWITLRGRAGLSGFASVRRPTVGAGVADLRGSGAASSRRMTSRGCWSFLPPSTA